MKYSIYKATNKVNGKIYIGRTTNLDRRIEEHHSDARNGSKMKFHDAIREFGQGKFVWEVIETTNTKRKARSLENGYIVSLESYKEAKGYNTNAKYVSGGGNSSKEIDMYSLDGVFIKSYLSSQQIEDESNGKYLSRNIRRNCNGELQRHKDRVFRFKGDEALPYKPIPSRAISIEVYDSNNEKIGMYQSMKSCAEDLGINPDNISLQLRGLKRFYDEYKFIKV